ncbi:MAG: deoxyhypusine synthase family protein [Syntrophobacteraceae bacterium]
MKNDALPYEKVRAIQVKKNKPLSQLIAEMSRTGFQGRKLAEVCDIFEEMIGEKDLTILMGYAGSLSVAGQWSIVSWLIEQRYIDILVATGANLTEDIVEGMGRAYYKGTHNIDDEYLCKIGFNRYYDIYGTEKDYLEMTELLSDFVVTLDETYRYSSREFLYLLGAWLGARGVKSILVSAAANKVPVFCPGVADSPVGDAALIAKSRGFTLTIDAIKDYIEFMSLAERVKNTGVFYVGGGVPKDFIQLFAVSADLLYPGRTIPNRDKPLMREGTDETYHPHKYAIQITSDSPQWGGLSGCTFEEATSWGKETSAGRTAQCFCDATIALPLLAHVIAEKVDTARNGVDFSEFFSIGC